MNKMIEGLEDAIKVAGCDHELQPAMRRCWPKGYSRSVCKKCGASFYTPLSNGHRETGE